MASEPFKITILGGGISGLFTALSLHHHLSTSSICSDPSPSFHITIYERAPTPTSGDLGSGFGIGLGVNATKLLFKVGGETLKERVDGIAGDNNGFWITFRRGDTGGEVVTILDPGYAKGAGHKGMHRGEFLEVLVGAVKKLDHVDLIGGKKFTRIREVKGDDGGKSVIEFSDGTTTSADLVIGCDGIHSAVRAQYTTDRPSYSGRIAHRGLVEVKDVIEGWPFESLAAQWMAPDRHFLVFPISSNKFLNVVAFVTKPEKDLGTLRESWTAEGSIADFREDFKDFDPTVQKIINLVGEKGNPSVWLINDRDPLPEWVFEDGKVVLVGDASHAMQPYQGAGAGQAVEDGYILGCVVRDFLEKRGKGEKVGGDIRPWLQLYQEIRLPRAQKVQKTSREAGLLYQMQSEELKGLSFEDCLPVIKEKMESRMKWIWNEDLDAVYEKAKVGAGIE
ncbi:hypothetical protein BGZ60DRAFT_405199 [Tricladium varicosporioides]|nr:hypothetical protein BGZ60DRAFT_405199 [Hymenoscyphus varicosporioides]